MTQAKSWRIAAIAIIGLTAAVFWRADANAQSPGAAATLPRVTATLTGPVVTVLATPSGQCEKGDFPDAPTRAFRDASGTMHLFASGTENYAMTGPDLVHVRHDCHPVMRSTYTKDPSQFADSHWLASFYTSDGRTVYALVHNEFHGWQGGNLSLCPSRDPRKCGYTSLLSAISTNGGQTFAIEPPPRGVVVTSPYRYEPDGGTVGYANPSNIIKIGGYYYVIFQGIGFRVQPHSLCLMRTATPNDPTSWRAWDGQGFTVTFPDPYTATGVVAERSVCKSLGPAVLGVGGVTVVQHQPDGVFILVGQKAEPALRQGSTGEYLVPAVSTSRNLIDWSPSAPLLSQEDELRLGSTHYPGLLDPASTDRNFATTGDTPNLIYVRLNKPGSVADRDLLRVPVRLRLVPP